MTVKEWLNRARRLDYEIDALISAKDRTWAKITSVTSSLSGVSVSATKDPHKFDSYVHLENMIDERIGELCSIKAEIAGVIEQVDNTILRTLLILRYVDCRTWEQIANETGYSYPAVTGKQHPKALREVKKYIEVYTHDVV